MMEFTSEEIREQFIQNVEKLNDRVQQLALIGIGIIWLFKIEESGAVSLRQLLFVPILLFVVTLILDLLHYFGVSHTWYKEIQSVKPENTTTFSTSPEVNAESDALKQKCTEVDKPEEAKPETNNSQSSNPKQNYKFKDVWLAYSWLLRIRLIGLVLGYIFLCVFLISVFTFSPNPRPTSHSTRPAPACLSASLYSPVQVAYSRGAGG